LKSLKKLPETTRDEDLIKVVGPIPEAFKKEFIDTKILEGYYIDIWKRIEQMKKLSDEKKVMEIPDRDAYEMREHVRKLIRDLAKVLKDKGIEDKSE